MKEGGLSDAIFEEGGLCFKVTLPIGAKRASSAAVSPEDQIMALFDTRAEIRSADVCEQLDVSKATAVSILTKLMKSDRVKRVGKGPKTHYVVTESSARDFSSFCPFL